MEDREKERKDEDEDEEKLDYFYAECISLYWCMIA